MRKLTEAEGLALLRLARLALRASYGDGEQPALATVVDPSTNVARNLERCAGAFVTLKRGSALRGCLGYTSTPKPLWSAVCDLAVSAASEDPRFEPVSPDEVKSLTISVSVLTQQEPIEANDVVVGRHGLVVEGRGRRGLLLPQVPVEFGWDRLAFLEHVCAKAKLPRQAWQEADCSLYGFEAQVFCEPLPRGT